MTTPRLLFVALFLIALFATTVHADTLSFQQGDGGAYSTTDGTSIDDAVLNFGSAARLYCVTNDNEAMLRFPDIIGNNPGQIPPGSTINVATLILTLAPAYDVAPPEVHRVFVPWDENTVTASALYAQPGAVGPTLTTVSLIDFYQPATAVITALLQDWVNGAANQGVLLRNPVPSYDPAGWYITQFFSDDEPTQAYRPKLVVDFTPVAVAVEPATWGKIKALYR